jgi:KEOPS complex subunit Pcc1
MVTPPDQHVATFRFHTDRARAHLAALEPELTDEEGMRSRATLVLVDDRTLELVVIAPDIPSLRAALNMWLRLVKIAEEAATLADTPGGAS